MRFRTEAVQLINPSMQLINHRAAFYSCPTASAIVLAGVGVDDLEVLDVVVRVGAERQLDAEALLHPDEQVGILAAQALEDRRVHEHAQRVDLPVLARLE